MEHRSLEWSPVWGGGFASFFSAEIRSETETKSTFLQATQVSSVVNHMLPLGYSSLGTFYSCKLVRFTNAFVLRVCGN